MLPALWIVAWWRKRGQFDAQRAWAGVRVPALVLIGPKDEAMDVAKNIAAYRGIQSENPRVELQVILNAGHSLLRGGQYADNFPSLVADWILRGIDDEDDHAGARTIHPGPAGVQTRPTDGV